MNVQIKRLTLDTPINIESINRLNIVLNEGRPVPTIPRSDIREALKNPLFFMFVIVGDDPNYYLGMASIFFQRNAAKWISEIHDVAVDEKCQGFGLGKSITKHLMETARLFCLERKTRLKLYLTSRPDRIVANPMYLKLGFTLVAKAVGPWGTNLYKMIVEADGFKGLE